MKEIKLHVISVKEKFDMNFIKIFGYCNQHNCKNNWSCFRYCEGAGKNNKTFVPKPKDYNNCEYYSPAKCSLCNGRGWNKDFDKTLRKFVKTDCLICKGTGKLDYHNFTGGRNGTEKE